MQSESTTLKLLNQLIDIPLPWRVTHYSFQNRAGLSLVIQHSAYNDFRCYRSECNGRVTVYDHAERQVEDFPAFGWRVRLKVRVPRLRCSQHGGTWRVSTKDWLTAHATKVYGIAGGNDALIRMAHQNAERSVQMSKPFRGLTSVRTEAAKIVNVRAPLKYRKGSKA